MFFLENNIENILLVDISEVWDKSKVELVVIK